ncbi:MAG: hypothetical protein KJO31_16495, partial [Gammaproteobacteria bacterium]|nr:hypothetical protein [Gammaproteobacteria bacterium]
DDAAEAESETMHEDTAVRAAMEIDHALISEMEEEQFAPAIADTPAADGPADDLRLKVPADAGKPDALAAAISVTSESVPTKEQEALNRSILERSAAALAPDLGPDNQPDREVDLDEWADELGKAEALDEINDVMAETLFGTVEASKISAEIVSEAAAGSLQAEDPVALEFVDIPDGAPLHPAAAAGSQSSNGAAPSSGSDAPQTTSGANSAALQNSPDAQLKNGEAAAAGAAPGEEPPPVAGALDHQDEDNQNGLLELFERASKR